MNRMGTSMTVVGSVGTIAIILIAVFIQVYEALVGLIFTGPMLGLGIFYLIEGKDCTTEDKDMILYMSMIPGQGSFLLGKYLRAILQTIALAIDILIFASISVLEQQYIGTAVAYSLILLCTLMGWSMLDTNQLCNEMGMDYKVPYDLDIKNYPRAKNIWVAITCIATAAITIPIAYFEDVIFAGIAITATHCVLSIVCLIVDGAQRKKKNKVTLHIQ